MPKTHMISERVMGPRPIALCGYVSSKNIHFRPEYITCKRCLKVMAKNG